jgi:hypothetical protein
MTTNRHLGRDYHNTTIAATTHHTALHTRARAAVVLALNNDADIADILGLTDLYQRAQHHKGATPAA